MDYIPLYPYDIDPLRILSPRRIREELPAAPPDPPQPPAPEPRPPESIDDPPMPVPRPRPGAGAAIPDAAYWQRPPARAAAGPAAQPGERGDDPAAPSGEPASPEGEHDRVVDDWLREHRDIVEAMARAGEAPRRPPPPPPPGPPPPVHVAPGDRWNKPKMAEFLRHLAVLHSVTAAARAVGMSRQSAHRLRNRLKGQPFDVAWEAAFRHGFDNLAYSALELALEGEEVPHYYQGELKGTHRKRNPNLILGLLKMRNQAGAPMLGRYGAAAEYFGERWDALLERVRTGSVTWDDEYEALGPAELADLRLPDEKRQVDLLIERNRPDERKGPSGK